MAATKLALHVTPRSGRDAVLGIKKTEAGDEVHVRVTAPPDGGKANKAVCKVIAGSLRVPKSGVEVVRGGTSRHKLVEVDTSQDVVDAWKATLPALD